MNSEEGQIVFSWERRGAERSLSQIIKTADSCSVVSGDYERSQTNPVTGCGVCLPLALSIRQLMRSSCVFDFKISTPDILLLITTANVIIIELRFSYDIDCWNHALAGHCVSIVNTKLVCWKVASFAGRLVDLLIGNILRLYLNGDFRIALSF